jgi:chromosome segregation ATPase
MKGSAGVRVVMPGQLEPLSQELFMANDMSFAQALNEAKGVILQLSNRVKTDAEKIRSQQQTIVSQSSTITQQESQLREQSEQITRHAEQVNAFAGRIKDAEAARGHAEAILNRQGERITSLEAANAKLETSIREHQSEISQLTEERDGLRSQLPSDEDAAALASMAQLLTKAAPAIEKAKKSSGHTMRLAGVGEGTVIAEAA